MRLSLGHGVELSGSPDQELADCVGQAVDRGPASELATFGGKARVAMMPTAGAHQGLGDPLPRRRLRADRPDAEDQHGADRHLDQVGSQAQELADVIEIRMSTPRLHHSSGTTAANPMASATPATTAMMRSSPLASSEIGVTCTTSIAVSGASSGWVLGKSRDATR
jgi:hypothetical protein